jgi:hypothetical protein
VGWSYVFVLFIISRPNAGFYNLAYASKQKPENLSGAGFFHTGELLYN